MEAVKASLFVAFSAFFRVLFAQRVGGLLDLKLCLAFSTLVLAIYTLDRSFDYRSHRELVLVLVFIA